MMDDFYWLYGIILSGATVYGVLLLMHEAGRRGWVMRAVNAVGRFVKYSVLRQKRGGA